MVTGVEPNLKLALTRFLFFRPILLVISFGRIFIIVGTISKKTVSPSVFIQRTLFVVSLFNIEKIKKNSNFLKNFLKIFSKFVCNLFNYIYNIVTSVENSNLIKRK